MLQRVGLGQVRFNLPGLSADTRGIAAGLTSLGAAAFRMSDPQRAAGLFEESLPLWRSLHDQPGLALTLGNLGEAIDHLGRADRAKPLYEESLELCRELGDKEGIAFSLSHLGRIARQEGEFSLAARYFTDCADCCRQIEDFARLAESIEGLAAVLADTGEHATAARLYGFAHGIRTAKSSPLPSVHEAAVHHDITLVVASLDGKAFDTYFAKGVSEATASLGADATLELPLLNSTTSAVATDRQRR